MKTFQRALFFALFFVTATTFAQEKYSSVRFAVPKEEILKNHLIGLLQLDHFHEQDGFITAEISESDVKKLRSSGFSYEVLIPDVAARLVSENEKYYTDRKNGLIRMDGSLINGRSAFDQSGNTLTNIIPTPASFVVQPTLGGYYSFAQMNAAMDALVAAYPALASKTSLGKSVQGRDIWCIKISDNVNVDETDEPEVLFMGLQHAREAIGGLSLIFFMQYLCEQYGVDSRIRDLVNNREIYIIVCVNPDGWEYNRTTNPSGGGSWRKNRKVIATAPGLQYGVDLNRNWGVDWANCPAGDLSCGNPSPVTTNDTYWGASAFSEPETQAIRAFVKTRDFSAMIDQHAYGPYYSLPFGRPSLHLQPDSLTLSDQQFFTQIPALMGKYNGMRAGNSPQTVGYQVAGGVKDWMLKGEIGVGSKGKIMGMTGEGGYRATSPTFWPPAAQIVTLCKGMVYQNLQLLYAAGSYVDIQDVSDIAVAATSGTFDFRLKRIGLKDDPVTISLIPLSNIATAGAPVTVSSLPDYYDTYTGGISYTLPANIANGQRIRFIWKVETGGYSYSDTITKFYNPVTMFTDNMDAGTVGTRWVVSAGWNYAADSGYANTRALTESPNAAYPNSTSRTARYNGTLNLVGATAAYLTFQTRYQAENFRDKLQVQVSTNGTTWTPIAGKTTVQEPGTLEGSTINGLPALTGIQDDWVYEVFNLSAYVGQSALRFRFAFTSDAANSFYGSRDAGFFIDNVKVIKTNTQLTARQAEFITVKGSPVSDGINLLEWKAEAVDPSAYFEVERSVDGFLFQPIGKIKPADPFRFTDKASASGINYYRIKSMDKEGKAMYSNTVRLPGAGLELITVYPNPAKDELTVRIQSDIDGPASLVITDLLGRNVYSRTMIPQATAGIPVKIDISRLVPQLYIIQLLRDKNGVLGKQTFLKE